MEIKTETRNSSWELKTTENSRTVEGYALKFNIESNDLNGFYEIIDSKALNGVIERSDVFCWLNHNEDRGLLARSKNGVGSLKLEVDAVGLVYRFEAPKTALGDELLEGLRRGDINTSSFGFRGAKDKWEKRSNGSLLRTVTQFETFSDVSPVYQPAYPDTTVAVRNMNQFQTEDLTVYFELLKNKIN